MLQSALDGDVGSSRESREEDLRKKNRKKEKFSRARRERRIGEGKRTNLELSNVGREPAVLDGVLVGESESNVGRESLVAGHGLDIGGESRGGGGSKGLDRGSNRDRKTRQRKKFKKKVREERPRTVKSVERSAMEVSAREKEEQVSFRERERERNGVLVCFVLTSRRRIDVPGKRCKKRRRDVSDNEMKRGASERNADLKTRRKEKGSECE